MATPATESFTAANRFGLGARPNGLGRLAGDPRGSLMQQIAKPESFQCDAPGLPDRTHIAQALTSFLLAHRA
nr:hypothetical protein [Betaproteobacteria bacterium]